MLASKVTEDISTFDGFIAVPVDKCTILYMARQTSVFVNVTAGSNKEQRGYNTYDVKDVIASKTSK